MVEKTLSAVKAPRMAKIGLKTPKNSAFLGPFGGVVEGRYFEEAIHFKAGRGLRSLEANGEGFPEASQKWTKKALSGVSKRKKSRKMSKGSKMAFCWGFSKS